jgi:hypothetical protein
MMSLRSVIAACDKTTTFETDGLSRMGIDRYGQAFRSDIYLHERLAIHA